MDTTAAAYRSITQAWARMHVPKTAVTKLKKATGGAEVRRKAFTACAVTRDKPVEGIGFTPRTKERLLAYLVEGAVLVVLGETVLLQKIVLQEAGSLQSDLVPLSQGVLQGTCINSSANQSQPINPMKTGNAGC